MNVCLPVGALLAGVHLVMSPAMALAQTVPAGKTPTAPEKPAPAAPEKSAVQALEVLFELGLPDTRGATWVSVQGPDLEANSPFPSNDSDEDSGGNAWLLKELPNGEVELLINQTQRVRVRQVKGDLEPDSVPGGIPQVQIAAVNLDKDVARLDKLLKRGAERTREAGELGEYELQEAMSEFQGTLLFLAHLHRQGRAQSVQKLLPMLLKAARTPDLLLDGAMDLLAEGRLANLCQASIAGGSAEEYARGIDGVTTEFTRGWTGKEAALELAKRIREQKPGAHSHEPLAQKAAQLLLTMKPEHMGELPLGRNWFLPGTEDEHGRARTAPLIPGTWVTPPSKTQAAKESPLAAFLGNKREAAAALAHLLDDHRLLRVGNRTGRPLGGAYRPDEEGPQASGTLRPYELGELAEEILSPLYPQELKAAGNPEGKSAQVLAWLQEISGLNEEELAWRYMRGAEDPGTADFQQGAYFLVHQGGKETLAKLQDVFSDPAVWTASEVVLPLLEAYLPRLGEERAAFVEKLEPLANRALGRALDTMLAQYGSSLDEDTRKQYEAQKNDQVRRLRQILHPRSFGEILDGMAKLSDEEAREELVMLMAALGEKVPAGAEAKIYQAAAKVKSSKTRLGLLDLISAMEGEGGPKEAKLDAATREALLVLLADDRSDEAANPWEGQNRSASVGEVTADHFAFPRMPEGQAEKWEALKETAPHLQPPWLRACAAEMVKTGQHSPVPDAARVSARQLTTLLAELAAAKPAEALAAFRKRKPDEQLAIVQHLTKTDAWPPTIAAAHFTVARAESDGKSLDAARWKGRVLDQALHDEILAETGKAALMGRACMIMMQSAGPLDGITITVRENQARMTSEEMKQMAGLDGKPRPAAALVVGLRKLTASSQAVMSGRRLGYGGKGYLHPLWKDEKLTSDWKKEHLKIAGTPKAPASRNDQQQVFENDPAGYLLELKSWLQLKPEHQGPTQIYLYSSLVAGEDEEATLTLRSKSPFPN